MHLLNLHIASQHASGGSGSSRCRGLPHSDMRQTAAAAETAPRRHCSDLEVSLLLLVSTALGPLAAWLLAGIRRQVCGDTGGALRICRLRICQCGSGDCRLRWLVFRWLEQQQQLCSHLTCSSIHVIVIDFGLSIGKPRARLQTPCRRQNRTKSAAHRPFRN